MIQYTIITVRPNGILETRMKLDWNQPDTPETAINFALTIKEVVGDNICGILSYLPGNLYMNKDVVKAFGSVDIGHVANAVIIKGIGSKILANFILKFVKTPVPMIFLQIQTRLKNSYCNTLIGPNN